MTAKNLAAAALLSLFAHLPAHSQRLAADGAPQTFHVLTDQYFEASFKFNPSSATAVGFHQYDAQLEDYSAPAVAAETAFLHAYEKKLSAIDPSALDAGDAADLAILLNNIRSQLLSLEVIRNWEKNPDNYSSGIASSAFVIMERNYAPADVRLRALAAREMKMPQVLLEARKNLKNPPHIFTEIALEQIDGLVSFFENDVPAAFTEATDPATKADFSKSNAAVIQSLKDYAVWLKSDLLPRSNGDYKLGADTFAKKLQYDEMVDIPLPHLLEVAYADLHRNQAEFARIAKDVDPTKTPQEVLAELASIHPAPDQLLNTFHQQFDQLIAFIRAKHIVTIPSDVQPTLEETPPFERATTQASMDSPGAYETHSTKAYFNVTLPEKDWTPERVAEHMAAFNIGTITSTAVHEAYPGHYVQFLYNPQIVSKVRKLTGAATDVEGWAHYCEQMMLDQGYAGGEYTRASGANQGYAAAPPNATPDQLKQARLIRLGQLQDALLRDARFVVSIKLHTGQITFDQAVDIFVKDGYQSHAIGLMETKRGTSDATYLYYTLGKLQIMKLRADVMKKEGTSFSLQRFHDDFLLQGPVPIKIIRRAMLHDDSPTL
jgi:uncharacterized protein (DUF885 family)